MADKKTSIATAYVQVIPSMSGVKGKLAEGFGEEGNSAGSIFSGSLVSAIKKTVLAAGLGTVLKEALTSGADMQQALGGIETLFQDSADIVIANAEQAYKTAGLSANEYMETVTSFSASLLQGLGGDTQEAARIADMALVDMSDNANKFGTDMESIQNAYLGFAKQNYTMLDNLKLGYGGTKTEMERLLADAQKLTGVKYDISNLDDVYEAIHVIQEEMGVTGTTAEESAKTFSGSLASMKAAASNLLANLALGEDITPSLEGLAKTVATFVGGNLIPMVGNILVALPQTIGGAITAFDWRTCLTGMMDTVKKIVVTYSDLIFSFDPSIIESVASGILENLPTIVDSAGEMIDRFVDFVIVDGLPQMLDSGVEMILSLVDGVGDCLPEVASSAGEILGEMVATFIENLPTLFENGGRLINELIAGAIGAIPDIIEAGGELIESFCGEFEDWDWLEVGTNIIEGIQKGIQSGVTKIANAAKEAAEAALKAAKDILGIKSPSRVFRDEVGAQIPPGIAIGVEQNSTVVRSSMEELADYAQDSFNADFALDETVNLVGGGNTVATAQADPVLALLQDVLDSNLQAYERIISLLELLLEAVLNIEFSGESITKLSTDYRRKMAVVKGG